MTNTPSRWAALALAATIAMAPAPSEAIAPVLLLLIRQLVQDAAKQTLKSMLLSSLSGMGCKGIALANAIQALDGGKGLGRAGGMLGMLGGMPGVAGGLGGMPSMPAGMAMPQLPGGMTIPGMPGGMGLPGGALLGLGGGLPAGMPPEMMAKMGRLMPGAGQLPPGLDLDDDQRAMMAEMMQAMGRPLSPPETLAVIDEMAELGFLPKAIQVELKECMVVLPSSIAALGMGMGMMKPMLPKLRKAREELHGLSPDEQDEAVAALAEELKPLPPDERAAMLEYLDTGFFPPRMAAGMKRALAAR